MQRWILSCWVGNTDMLTWGFLVCNTSDLLPKLVFAGAPASWEWNSDTLIRLDRDGCYVRMQHRVHTRGECHEDLWC